MLPVLFLIHLKITRVVPDTFKDDINVVILNNVAIPDTFKVDINVVSLFKRVE